MRSFWVVDDNKEYAGILADTYEQAEDIFWQGVVTDEYPFDAIIIEMMLDDGDFQIVEEVDDADIISIEDPS